MVVLQQSSGNELYESVKEHLLDDVTEEMKAYVAYFDRQ